MKILVHYHEIALKGANRPFFISKLARNLARSLADLGPVHVERLAGRLLIEAPDAISRPALYERVSSVFGVANFAITNETPPDVESLKASVVSAVGHLPARSFRVTSKRADKSFPRTSTEIERELGEAIQRKTGWSVNLDHPERTVYVEVLRDRILFACEKLPGPGGLPVGSSGRVACLLSGGIDSPVAAARLMRRGCRNVFVHFHAFPLVDRATIEKARRLAQILTRFQYRSLLLLVPFSSVQQRIVAACPAALRVILYRRLMIRIAESLAHHHRAKALVTGESLGQVASQTLDNLSVIDEASQLPLLRPLIGMDKEEIVREAKRIGTFETSTLPDMDCCQLYMPQRPTTAARISEVRNAEKALDLTSLVSEAVRATDAQHLTFPATPGRDD